MRPSLRAAMLAGALALGAATLGAATLALGQTEPTPAPGAPPASPPPHATEEPPPAAAQVPTVVPPAPTPDAPPQEIAPAPAAPTERARSSDKPQEDLKPPPPPKRTLYNAAILEAVDKVTAESLRFEIQVRQPVRYKGLIFILHTCEASTSGQLPAAFAHLEIDSQPQPLPGRPPNPARLVFRGWMAADAPGLHPLEHPVYDAWLIACKTASGPASAARR